MSDSMNKLSAEAALWAASVVVEDMKNHEMASQHNNSKPTAVSRYKAKLEMCGVKTLKKPQLLSLWNALKDEPFVLAANLSSIRKGDKVDVWKGHIAKCLDLEGSKQLKAVAIAADPPPPAAAPPSAAIPAAASLQSSIPSAPSLPPPAASPSAAASAPRNQLSKNAFPGNAGPLAEFRRGSGNVNQINDLRRLIQQQQQQHQHFGQQQYQRHQGQFPSFFSTPPFAGMATMAATTGGDPRNHNRAAHGAAMAANMAGHGGSMAQASRKRKTPGMAMDLALGMDMGRGMEMGFGDIGDHGAGEVGDPFLESMLASLGSPSNGLAAATGMPANGLSPPAAAAAAAANSAASGAANEGENSLSPLESRILSELQQMGFEDKKECVDAIRRVIEKKKKDGEGGNPTSDEVMLNIISTREEAEESKKMDEARIQSERTVQEESERLRERRREDEVQRVLDATFEELRNPTNASNHKLMYPESWLLRHEECVNELTEVANNPRYLDTKKVLIEILKLEKNCKKWYSSGLPKYYFTFELGKRIVTAHANGDQEALCKEMKTMLEEGNQGILLSTEDIPPILLSAKEKYQDDSQAAGQDTADDDDDDDVVVLTNEEVRQMRAMQSTDSSPGLDTAGPLIAFD